MNNIILNAQKEIKPGKTARILDKFFHNNKVIRIESVDSYLCRGSNVPIKKIAHLKTTGIKRVINLRTLSKNELNKLTEEYKKHGIEFYNLPINLLNFKDNLPILVKVLKEIMKDKKHTLVHCTNGIDRTGGFVGTYLKIIKNWSTPDVINDMHEHNFKGLHKVLFFNIKNSLKNLEPQFQEFNA